MSESTPLTEVMAQAHTAGGQSLLELTNVAPTLVVFLRHFG